MFRRLIMPYVAKRLYLAHQNKLKNFEAEQSKQLFKLLKTAQKTSYGKRYGFGHIQSIDQFKAQVPIVHYHDLIPHIEAIAQGAKNILWPKSPVGMVHSSGSSGGHKHLPIFKSMIKSQHKGRLIALCHYAHQAHQYDCFTKPLLILSAADAQKTYGQYSSQLLSHILANRIPKALQALKYPSKDIQKLTDFKARMAHVGQDILQHGHEISGLVGFPPWIHFLIQQSTQQGYDFKQQLKHLNIYVSSGMSITPYEKAIRAALPDTCKIMQTYPSSEGFLGFTPTPNEHTFCFMPSNGIYYEFIALDNYHQKQWMTTSIDALKTHQDYVLVISNNSGLFRYIIGDTIQFSSLQPLLFKISGRIGNTLGIVGEHLNQQQWDQAIHSIQNTLKCPIYLNLVCAKQHTDTTAQQYEVLLETDDTNHDIQTISDTLHQALKQQNILYETYAHEGLITTPKITLFKAGELLNKQVQTKTLNEQSKWQSICNDYDFFQTIKQANNL